MQKIGICILLCGTWWHATRASNSPHLCRIAKKGTAKQVQRYIDKHWNNENISEKVSGITVEIIGRDGEGVQALKGAIRKNNIPTTLALLQNGVDPNWQAVLQKKPPAFYAMQSAIHDMVKQELLHTLCIYGGNPHPINPDEFRFREKHDPNTVLSGCEWVANHRSHIEKVSRFRTLQCRTLVGGLLTKNLFAITYVLPGYGARPHHILRELPYPHKTRGGFVLINTTPSIPYCIIRESMIHGGILKNSRTHEETRLVELFHSMRNGDSLQKIGPCDGEETATIINMALGHSYYQRALAYLKEIDASDSESDFIHGKVLFHALQLQAAQ